MRNPEGEEEHADGAESSGGSPGLPGLPPAWGRITIPDDAAALAAEAEAVRRELGVGPPRPAASPAAARLPLFVLAIAVLATLASFLAAMWPNQSHLRPGPARETDGRPADPAHPVDPTGRALPALEVVDDNGSAIALRSLLPAVILLVEECACPAAVAAAAAAVPPGVTVVALFSGVPRPKPLPAGPTTAPVRSLADPAGGLRGFLRAPARPGEAATLLVTRSGRIVRFLPAPRSPQEYQAELPGLSQLAPGT